MVACLLLMHKALTSIPSTKAKAKTAKQIVNLQVDQEENIGGGEGSASLPVKAILTDIKRLICFFLYIGRTMKA